MIQIRISSTLIAKLENVSHPRIIVGTSEIQGTLSVGCSDEIALHETANLLQLLLPGGFYVTGIFIPNIYINNIKYKKQLDSIKLDTDVHLLSHDKMGNIKSLQPNVTLIRADDNSDMLDVDALIHGNAFIDLTIPVMSRYDEVSIDKVMDKISRYLESAVVISSSNEITGARQFRIITSTVNSSNENDVLMDDQCWLSIRGWFFTCALTVNNIIEDIERTIYARLPAKLKASYDYSVLPCRCTIAFSTLELSDYQHVNDNDVTTVERMKNNFRITSIIPSNVRHTIEQQYRAQNTPGTIKMVKNHAFNGSLFIAFVTLLVLFFAYYMQIGSHTYKT